VRILEGETFSVELYLPNVIPVIIFNVLLMATMISEHDQYN
jgi:hypothetical protein